jgi:hypothetical protein
MGERLATLRSDDKTDLGILLSRPPQLPFLRRIWRARPQFGRPFSVTLFGLEGPVEGGCLMGLR